MIKSSEVKTSEEYNWPRRRGGIVPIVVGALAAGAILLIPRGERFDDPEFIVQGSVAESEAEFQAGVKLDCNERGVLEAVIVPKIELVVDREEPGINQDKAVRFRRIKSMQIRTGEDTCEDALQAVRSDLSLVGDPLAKNVASLETQIFGDGNSRDGVKYIDFLSDYLEENPDTPIHEVTE